MVNNEKLSLNIELIFNEDGTLDMQFNAQSPVIEKVNVDSQGNFIVPKSIELSEMEKQVLITIANFDINVERFVGHCMHADLEPTNKIDTTVAVVPVVPNSTKH